MNETFETDVYFTIVGLTLAIAAQKKKLATRKVLKYLKSTSYHELDLTAGSRNKI